MGQLSASCEEFIDRLHHKHENKMTETIKKNVYMIYVCLCLYHDLIFVNSILKV